MTEDGLGINKSKDQRSEDGVFRDSYRTATAGKKVNVHTWNMNKFRKECLSTTVIYFDIKKNTHLLHPNGNFPANTTLVRKLK